MRPLSTMLSLSPNKAKNMACSSTQRPDDSSSNMPTPVQSKWVRRIRSILWMPNTTDSPGTISIQTVDVKVDETISARQEEQRAAQQAALSQRVVQLRNALSAVRAEQHAQHRAWEESVLRKAVIGDEDRAFGRDPMANLDDPNTWADFRRYHPKDRAALADAKVYGDIVHELARHRQPRSWLKLSGRQSEESKATVVAATGVSLSTVTSTTSLPSLQSAHSTARSKSTFFATPVHVITGAELVKEEEVASTSTSSSRSASTEDILSESPNEMITTKRSSLISEFSIVASGASSTALSSKRSSLISKSSASGSETPRLKKSVTFAEQIMVKHACPHAPILVDATWKYDRADDPATAKSKSIRSRLAQFLSRRSAPEPKFYTANPATRCLRGDCVLNMDLHQHLL
ncbi:hypothetical protein BKA62DRAFT_703472 [Auriculariales sp. MPI-PUGE-AT-0066]|nr:hypothetical protein BKA62DRAFT_703472 [Auriculariales sp. MPI-PUGE-AT-0066]